MLSCLFSILQGYQGAIAGARTLSEKALAGAATAATRVEEADALLQKAEQRLGQRLDEAVQSQVTGRCFLPIRIRQCMRDSIVRGESRRRTLYNIWPLFGPGGSVIYPHIAASTKSTAWNSK